MSKRSGPAYISEADARSVVQAQYPHEHLCVEGTPSGEWNYLIRGTIVATAHSCHWQLDWKNLRPTIEREPTYMSMEDAVRELDTAPITAATRQTVNRMREEILWYRELDRPQKTTERAPCHE